MAITWSPQKERPKETADERIYALLDSCYKGMGKALATEPERVFYTFRHWFWDRLRPKAKKQVGRRLGARLLLDPETEEPWLLIFDPQQDGSEVLKHGEPEEYRTDEGEASQLGLEDDSGLDPADAETGLAGAEGPSVGSVEGD